MTNELTPQHQDYDGSGGGGGAGGNSETPVPQITDPEPHISINEAVPEPIVLDSWDSINILDIPDDAVTPEGSSIWEIIRIGTGLAKSDIKNLQAKYVDSKGRPVALYMVGIGNFTFIIREITTKLHREIIQACHIEERKYFKPDTEGNVPETVDDRIRSKWEEIHTIKAALVWPTIGSGNNEFDPEDEDLPFLIVSQLFTKILEASGAYEMPLLKKV